MAVQAWSPYLQKDIDTIERVQRRATKMIPELRHKTYEERLRVLKLTTLQARREKGDLIQQFKIHKGTEKVSFKNEQKTPCYSIPVDCRPPAMAAGAYKNKYKIRGNHQQAKSLIRQNFYTNRVVSKWNDLDDQTIESINLNAFKNKLDNTHYSFSF